MPTVKRYQSNPHQVEAIQFTGDNADAVVSFAPHVLTWFPGQRMLRLVARIDKPGSVDRHYRELDILIETGDYVVHAFGLYVAMSEGLFRDRYGPLE